MKTLRDSFGRRIDYLRLSVTDKCNLRCAYCSPAAEVRRPMLTRVLSDGVILSMVESLAQAGIRRVRVTGGEPLVRPFIAELVSGIKAVRGIEDVSMSTNGTLLARAATGLAAAGLDRINISMDTLDRERFCRITGVDGLDKVVEGVEAALEAGLHPVKLNVVVMRGINDDEIPDFVGLTRDRPLHVRFIELMPMGGAGFYTPEKLVPVREIRERCGPLEPLPKDDAPAGAGPASYLRAPGCRGTVGFIGAMSERFCGRCNRVRLTSAGRLLSCLAQKTRGEDLGALLRSGGGRGALLDAVRRVVAEKAERHSMQCAGPGAGENRMCAVGG